MITQTIINFIVGAINTVFASLPTARLSDLPVVGSTITDTLSTIIETWNAFLITFPYAVVLWNCFIYVILPFEILLLIAKFFLGHRVPAHTTN